MGRKNVVSKRIVEILDGKLLRFTDIFKEYEKIYHVKAFQSISRNLEILQHKGVVSKIVDHFCLTDDLTSGRISGKQIRHARNQKVKIDKVSAKIDRATEIEMNAKWKALIARNDPEEMRRAIKSLEKSIELLTQALQVGIPLASQFDYDRIQKLIVSERKQIEQLKEILKKGAGK